VNPEVVVQGDLVLTRYLTWRLDPFGFQTVRDTYEEHLYLLAGLEPVNASRVAYLERNAEARQ
jgi:hypothetical protein